MRDTTTAATLTSSDREELPALKNYPNQASTIERIRRTLEVVRDLEVAGNDVGDDGVLGYAAARAQAYTFRSLDYEGPDLTQHLEARIAEEQQKPSGSQGARTFARELRRTLTDLGWLDADHHLTQAGQDFLASLSGSQEEREGLATGLLGIAANPGPSHPVRIMLRLLAIKESRERQGLELALEAADDSQAEFDRVAGLYQMSAEDRHAHLTANGVTDPQIANAKKIFPSLARDAGLVVEYPPRVYRLSDVGRARIGSPALAAGDLPPAQQEVVRQALRAVSPEDIAAALGAGESKPLSAEDQLKARQALADRTKQHQQTVQRLAKLFVPGGSLQEGSVDLLWSRPDASEPVVLVEVKTIKDDADSQVRQAYGQLAYYEYFDVRPIAGGRPVLKVVATDADVPSKLGDFLNDLGVVLISVTAFGWIPRNAAAEAVMPFLEPPIAEPTPT